MGITDIIFMLWVLSLVLWAAMIIYFFVKKNKKEFLDAMSTLWVPIMLGWGLFWVIFIISLIYSAYDRFSEKMDKSLDDYFNKN